MRANVLDRLKERVRPQHEMGMMAEASSPGGYYSNPHRDLLFDTLRSEKQSKDWNTLVNLVRMQDEIINEQRRTISNLQRRVLNNEVAIGELSKALLEHLEEKQDSPDEEPVGLTEG